MCVVIYGSNWYTYDVISQRMIILMLQEAQTSKEITLGIIGPLNVVTGIQVLNLLLLH